MHVYFSFQFYFSNNDDVLLISVENPNLTAPITSKPTGILNWLAYDLPNSKVNLYEKS